MADRTGFVSVSMAPATVAAYRSDWARFSRWCERTGHRPLPASGATVAAYLADAASQPGLRRRPGTLGESWRYTPATLGRWTAGIAKAHELAGLPSPASSPEVLATMAGIRRSRAAPPVRRVPLLLDDLERIVAGLETAAWPAGVAGVRDRALLVFGWTGAFRRSELAGLAVGDITLHSEDGLHVRLRHSKTDQASEGTLRALPYARRRPVLCAPCAWAAWRQVVDGWDSEGRPGAMRALRGLEMGRHGHLCAKPFHTGDPDSPAFRSVRPNGTLGGPITGHAVNSMVKRRAAAAGLPAGLLGGHSLRSGFVTEAFRKGADAHAIMRQTGHRSPAMLEVYAREGAPLVGNAVTGLGL